MPRRDSGAAKDQCRRVTYTQAGQYFEKRQLGAAPGSGASGGSAIAAVISGEFSGWNVGLGTTGWGPMLIAMVLVDGHVLHHDLLDRRDVRRAMPHTGGAYSFARAAMGPWGGFVTGSRGDDRVRRDHRRRRLVLRRLRRFRAGRVHRAFAAAVGVVDRALRGLRRRSTRSGRRRLPVGRGGRRHLARRCIVRSSSVAAFAFGAVDFSRLYDIAPADGGSEFMPFGGDRHPLRASVRDLVLPRHRGAAARRRGVAHPTRRHPPGRFWGVARSRSYRAARAVPQPRGDRHRRDHRVARRRESHCSPASVRSSRRGSPRVLALFALMGLLASLQGIMFAYGRNMYSLSRAGYYPRFLSLTGKRETPWVALVVGAVIGFRSARSCSRRHGDQPGGAGGGAGVILYIAIWGAVIAYVHADGVVRDAAQEVPRTRSGPTGARPASAVRSSPACSRAGPSSGSSSTARSRPP